MNQTANLEDLIDAGKKYLFQQVRQAVFQGDIEVKILLIGFLLWASMMSLQKTLPIGIYNQIVKKKGALSFVVGLK